MKSVLSPPIHSLHGRLHLFNKCCYFLVRVNLTKDKKNVFYPICIFNMKPYSIIK